MSNGKHSSESTSQTKNVGHKSAGEKVKRNEKSVEFMTLHYRIVFAHIVNRHLNNEMRWSMRKEKEGEIDLEGRNSTKKWSEQKSLNGKLIEYMNGTYPKHKHWPAIWPSRPSNGDQTKVKHQQNVADVINLRTLGLFHRPGQVRLPLICVTK